MIDDGAVHVWRPPLDVFSRTESERLAGPGTPERVR